MDNMSGQYIFSNGIFRQALFKVESFHLISLGKLKKLKRQKKRPKKAKKSPKKAKNRVLLQFTSPVCRGKLNEDLPKTIL